MVKRAPWTELRLDQIGESAQACGDACAADVVSLIAAFRVAMAALERIDSNDNRDAYTAASALDEIGWESW